MARQSDVSRIELIGHLTEPALAKALRGVELPESGSAVILDCTNMTGYDLAARHAFVDWNRARGARVSRVAVVTSNKVWWMVIGAMSLASGRPMKAFDTVQEAIDWAKTG